MGTTIDLTFEFLESTLKDYFNDHFENLTFKVSQAAVIPVLSSEVEPPSLTMVGYRGKYKCSYTFFIQRWDGYFKDGSLFHRMENIKGEMIRSEQTILLEHNSNKTKSPEAGATGTF